MGNAAATFDLRERANVRSVAAERTASIPWYVWCLAAATAADWFGGYWDISWHISIGRDTFWTPAHMMIYLAGVLAGVASGYAILSTTFGSSEKQRTPASRSGVFAGRSDVSWRRGADSRCLPRRRSTTGGTTPTDWMSKSSACRTRCWASAS